MVEFDDSKPLDWSKVEKFPGIVELYKELFRLRRNAFGTTKGLLDSMSTCTTSTPTAA